MISVIRDKHSQVLPTIGAVVTAKVWFISHLSLPYDIIIMDYKARMMLKH